MALSLSSKSPRKKSLWRIPEVTPVPFSTVFGFREEMFETIRTNKIKFQLMSVTIFFKNKIQYNTIQYKAMGLIFEFYRILENSVKSKFQEMFGLITNSGAGECGLLTIVSGLEKLLKMMLHSKHSLFTACSASKS